MPAKIINVANRLPVTIGERFEKSSGGLVAALEGVSGDEYRLHWIGWPGSEIDDPFRREEVCRILESEYGSTPVFITADEAHGFYAGLANSSLWPLLHYMPRYFHYEPQWWDAYKAVNARFAEAILKVARPQDLIWVHDYQLLLLPGLLKSENPDLRVGFFLHTPFPSYEIFRCHPNRTELIAGMLDADVIGFHTFGYMRHFRSAVLRILGIDSQITRIRHDGRTTALGIYPIGINAPKFEEELKSQQFHEELESMRQAYEGKRIVLSVERLDYTKGILSRLDAIDMFLARCEDRDAIKFVFVSVPSREGVEEYQNLREEVETRVGRLNGNYATLHNSPIHFIHGSVNFTQLCALYSIADVGLVTPLIDGMNLVAKEYVACQREEPGVLILSEFAGAAEELFNAISVNPYDARAVAEQIEVALRMPLEERRERMEPMRQRVMRFDATTWARAFIRDLAAHRPSEPSASNLDEVRRRLRAGLEGRQRIALFLDYDGTLREIEREPMAASPSDPVRAVLRRLAETRGIDVTIISGRSADNLEQWLGEFGFGLIAEHGASLRRTGNREWEQLDRNVSYAWKTELMKVLRLYVDSTPGSFIEDKRTSLVWHYRQADPEFGEWKAKMLTEELAVLTASEPLVIRHGKKIVEITSSHINKGAAVQRMLEEQKYDLVLVAGDDETDESMFRLEIPNLISIRVGDGDTRARYHVPKPTEFRRLLLDIFR